MGYNKRKKERNYHLKVKQNDTLHEIDRTHQLFACAKDCTIHKNVFLPDTTMHTSFGVTIPYWWLYAPITLQYYGKYNHDVTDVTYRT